MKLEATGCLESDMKIIKEGRNQKGWAKELECTGEGNSKGGCGAILLVEEGDIFHTHHYDYGGGHDIYTSFECAACGVITDIDAPSRRYPDYADWKKLLKERSRLWTITTTAR